MNQKPRVLVICTGNSMRSQMAEGLLRADLGQQIEVSSAGTHPSSVHPLAIKTMAEIGIDISSHHSKSVREFVGENIDLVITVCDSAAEICPVLPGASKTIHRGYPDPIASVIRSDGREVFALLRDRMRRELRDVVIKELHLDPPQ